MLLSAGNEGAGGGRRGGALGGRVSRGRGFATGIEEKWVSEKRKKKGKNLKFCITYL